MRRVRAGKQPVCGTGGGLASLTAWPGGDGEGGSEGRPTRSGAHRPRERCAFDPGRGGKLPAGGRLQCAGYVHQASKHRN